MTTAVGAVVTAVDAVLAEPWWQRSDADVRGAVLSLERRASRLEAARLRLLAEADARRVGASAGAVTTAAWLSAEAGLRPERAAERVALAGALAGPLAATGAALAAGDLGVDAAGVIHRTMTALGTGVDATTAAEAEAFLVGQAARLDPRQLAVVGRRLRARLRRDAAERLAREEDAALTRSEVRLVQDDEGVWHLHGTLDAVSGAKLAAVLDDVSAPLPAVDGVPDRRCPAQRRAEGLVRLADAWLVSRGGAGESRPRLVVTVPAETVLDPSQLGAAPGVLDGGHPVSAVALAQLACDAEVLPVLLDPRGVPLDVGRTWGHLPLAGDYAFPDRIRRAVLLRDGGCTFHGCGRPASWCQIHHLTAFSQGGATSERNGACLCGYHHRLVHRRGWRGELVGAQVVWHPPDRDAPEVPPPPWLPALDRLVERWRLRAA